MLNPSRPIVIATRPPAALAFARRVGAGVVFSDTQWSGFAPSASPPWVATRESPADPPRGAGGRAWLLDAEREFETYAAEGLLRVRFPGLLSFDLIDGSELRWHEAPSDPLAAEEALLGAGLVLALSQRGCFCLHASAVLDPAGEALLFVGASGAGKSTVARLLEQQVGWRRLSDDITPVELGAAGAVVHPHFPQLKLDPAQQYPDDAPGTLPLRAILLLSRSSSDGAIAIAPSASSAAFRAVVAQTAAARLMPPPLLAAHLQYAERLVSCTPIFDLELPHRPEALESVALELAAALQAQRHA